jgi:hypothetical protein
MPSPTNSPAKAAAGSKYKELKPFETKLLVLGSLCFKDGKVRATTQETKHSILANYLPDLIA